VTIYIPSAHELPQDQLSRLGPGSIFSLLKVGECISSYIYEWSDLKVILNVLPDSEVPGHLDGFVGWVHSVAAALGRLPDVTLLRRIRSTTMILGFVVEGTTDRDVWHDRVEDIIAMICFNTGALLFWEGAIFDENCQQLLPDAA
jgi:hypothetical protein